MLHYAQKAAFPPQLGTGCGSSSSRKGSSVANQAREEETATCSLQEESQSQGRGTAHGPSSSAGDLCVRPGPAGGCVRGRITHVPWGKGVKPGPQAAAIEPEE